MAEGGLLLLLVLVLILGWLGWVGVVDVMVFGFISIFFCPLLGEVTMTSGSAVGPMHPPYAFRDQNTARLR